MLQLSCMYYSHNLRTDKLSMASANYSIPKRKADELLVEIAITMGMIVGVSITIWFIFFSQGIVIIGSLFAII